MGELETAVSAPFVHMHASSLNKMQLIFYYTQDKRWMGIDDAKKLIELSVSSGYYSKNEKGEYELVEHLKSEKIPLGFKPTDAIFSTIVVKPDPIEGVLRAVAQASGKEPMILASELQRIRSHYDNLIADNAGVIMLARCYNVDISVYMPDLLKSIEKE